MKSQLTARTDRAPRAPESQSAFLSSGMHLSCCVPPTCQLDGRVVSKTGLSVPHSGKNAQGMYIGHMCSVTQNHTQKEMQIWIPCSPTVRFYF